MVDVTNNVVENTQRSACASSQERAVDEQFQAAGDITTDTCKCPNVTLPPKVPSYMCNFDFFPCMCHYSLLLIFLCLHDVDDGVHLVLLACIFVVEFVVQMVASMVLSLGLV